MNSPKSKTDEAEAGQEPKALKKRVSELETQLAVKDAQVQSLSRQLELRQARYVLACDELQDLRMQMQQLQQVQPLPEEAGMKNADVEGDG